MYMLVVGHPRAHLLMRMSNVNFRIYGELHIYILPCHPEDQRRAVGGGGGGGGGVTRNSELTAWQTKYTPCAASKERQGIMRNIYIYIYIYIYTCLIPHTHNTATLKSNKAQTSSYNSVHLCHVTRHQTRWWNVYIQFCNTTHSGQQSC